MNSYFDSHAHPLWAHALDKQLNLRGSKNCEAFVQKLSQRSANERSTLYDILAYGWNESEMNESLESLEDAFRKKVPQEYSIMAMRVCGHKAFATEAFKKKYNIKNAGPSLFEDEIRSLQHLWLSNEESFEVFDKLKKIGITSFADLSVSAHEIDLYKKNYEKHKLQVQLFVKIQELKKIEAPFEFIQKDSCLQLRYVKFFLDGTFGAQTAWLSQAYTDKEGCFGISLWNYDELKRNVLLALEKNFLVAFHVIGDAAIDQALQIGTELATELKQVIDYQNTKFKVPALHRLEHLQLCRDDQIEKLSQQKLWALGLQPSHRLCDESFSLSRLGATRLEKEAYRLKSFIDAGLKVSLGSDGPIAPFDPSFNIKAACEDPRLAERLMNEECEALMSNQGRLNAGFPIISESSFASKH